MQYTPINSDSHTVYVTIKNKLGVESTASFVIVTHGNPVITYCEVDDEALFVLQRKDWYPGFSTYLFYSCSVTPIFRFDAYSGGDTLDISSISIGMRIDGKVPNGQFPMSVVKKDIKSSITSYTRDYISMYGINLSYDKKTEMKVEIINSKGFKTEFTIPIKIKEIKV